MNIAVADNNGLKFTSDLIDHWKEKGHQVKFERGTSEHLAQWADLYYVDTWDNNIHYLYKLYNGDPDHNRTENWDNNKKPQVICRVLDWEVWIGWVRDQAIVDWVDKIIFIAPHIQEKVKSEVNLNGKDKLIRPGVNLEKFTLKTNKNYGFNLGMVLGDMWWPKNHIAGLDIFTSLYKKDPRWTLHIRGQHEGGNEFWKKMFDYYLESRGIKDVVTLYPFVEDMNQWYEKIDILLHPGMKEAFCYAIGEAMAKGITIVANDFFGSHDIWPEDIIYQTHDQAIQIINKYISLDNFSKRAGERFTRNYIESNYSLKKQLKETDEYLGV